MKSTLAILIALIMLLLVTPTAGATSIFSICDADIGKLTQVSPTPPTHVMYWENKFYFTLGNVSGWQYIQYGTQLPTPIDLSDFDMFNLLLDNCSGCTRNIKASIWMTTGSSNKYYESDWEWLLPGDILEFSIDFSKIKNIDKVTGFGVSFGTNVTALPPGPLDPDNKFESPGGMQLIGSVHPIPEPEPVTLICIGFFGLVFTARVNRSNKFGIRIMK